MNLTLFEEASFNIRETGGKSHYPISYSLHSSPPPVSITILDKDNLLWSSKKHNKMIFRLKKAPIFEVCDKCLATGETTLSPLDPVPCPYCGGSGYVKECTCGSGIKIGSDESFCIMCRPRPLPPLKFFPYKIYPYL